MPDEKDDFESAMRKLASETRRGLAKTQPLTPKEKRAIRDALENPPAPAAPRQEQTKKRIEKRQDHGHGHDL